MPGKTYIKTGTDTWRRVRKVYMKTGGQTWTAVRKVYMKVSETGQRWRKVFDSPSSRPFIVGNDNPKIRLNTFRTNSTYDPSGTANDPVNPVVEAPPVQQMGPPTTTPTEGWPNGTIGNHLWGYDGNWSSPNGTAISFTYQWLYNLTGDPNDNTFDPAFSPEQSSTTGASNTSSTGRADMLTNTATYLGRSDGDYFDKNFLTFRVRATNTAGTTAAESQQVYIVRQLPSGSITMRDPSIATPNTAMIADVTWSNNWHNKTDISNSYIEWFMVNNIGDALTTSNRVSGPIYLSSLTASGTTTRSSTTSFTPTGTTYQNKYAYVRLTLNNSSTQNAVISISGFTPKSSPAYTSNKSVPVVTGNGPFNLTNAKKFTPNTNGSTSGRTVSVDIGKSENADRYEVEIWGRYPKSGGIYDTSVSASSWVRLQSLAAAPYVYESARSSGTLTYTATNITDYREYRFTARSRNGVTLNGAAYSDGGTGDTEAQLVFITAPSVAPDTPVISNITTSTDTFGSFVEFSVSSGSSGSNSSNYFEYSTDGGSTWLIPTSNYGSVGAGFINTTTAQIYVTANLTINMRIRHTNMDASTSGQSNQLTIVAAAQPGALTNIVIRSFLANQGTAFFTTGSNTGSVDVYFEFDDFSTFDSINNYANVASNTAGQVTVTGATSTTRSYTTNLRPYSNANKTGATRSFQSAGGKVLNGSDAMSITSASTSGTPTTTSIAYQFTASGSTNRVRARIYQGSVSDANLIQDKGYLTYTGANTSTTFTGLTANTGYIIVLNPRYEYATGVTYEGNPFTSSTQFTASLNAQPFTTSSFSKGRINEIVSGKRRLQLGWNQSVNAEKYEIQYEGRDYHPTLFPGSSSAWTVLQSFAASPYTYEPTRSNTYDANYWFFYRATIRASSPSGVFAYNDGGTVSSLVYREADGTASSDPVIGTITTPSPHTSTTSVTVNYTAPTNGSATIYQNEYKLGVNGAWTVASNGSFTISGLSASTTYTVYMRSLNYDAIYSAGQANATFTTSAAPVLYTVTWNANGGTPNPSATQQATQGASVSVPTVTRSGYTFTGWWNSSTGGTRIIAPGTTTYTPTSNITLWAQWNLVPAPGTPSVSSVTSTSNRINFNTISFGSNTDSVLVEWGTTTAYSTGSSSVTTNGGSYSTPTNLSGSTTYFYRLRGYSAAYGGYGDPLTGSIVTATPFVTPTSPAPTVFFQRFNPSGGTANSGLRWYWDSSGFSGSVSYQIGMEWQIRTLNNTTSTPINQGTYANGLYKTYPGDGTYPFTVAGNIWQYRVQSSADTAHTTSARFLRARNIMMGTNGTVYYGTWSNNV